MTRDQELNELHAFLDVNFGPVGAPHRITMIKYTSEHRMSDETLNMSCLPLHDLLALAQGMLMNSLPSGGLPNFVRLRAFISAVAAIELRIERLEATEQ